MTTKTMTPQIVRLKASLPGKDLGARFSQVLALAADAGMNAPKSFESPLGGRSRPIDSLDIAALKQPEVAVTFEDGARLVVSAHSGAPGVLIQASRSDDALTEEQASRALAQQAALLRSLFQTGVLESGTLERLETGVDALPDVPLASRMPAIVVTDDQVAAAYADPKAFWAAWDEHQTKDSRHLLLRHLDAVSTQAWFRACFDGQWAMARAARPGDTFYGKKAAPPGCEEILMQGQSCLRQVGLRDGHVELAGFVPKGGHVPAWEILSWKETLRRGSLGDGSAVSTVRVVFRNEEMARREASPLLDIGAQVAFLGRDGAYHPVAGGQNS